MRLFVAIAVVLVAGGVFLIVDGGLRLHSCMELGIVNYSFWTPEFWLAVVGDARQGLGPNGHWFLRLAGGLVAAIVGWIVLRIARR
ncbi:MAG: hypothetical protein KC503_12970 [Myxococcales bacterium]|nr:hypothetical protein [Myxococcales bacterium]